MNFYSNNQIVYDYYNTNVYKNQYQSTFQNGGYLQSPFIHPKGISHPPLSIIQNGKKIEYQTEKISLFSTYKCQSIEDVIPKKESGLLDSILSDASFMKYLEKYGLKRKEIHSWLVIQHEPITNSVSNLYVVFLLETKSNSDDSVILPDSLDQWIIQSENSESNMMWMTNFMNSASVSININDYLTGYSNHIGEKQYHMCENENVVFIKKPVLCSFIPIQQNKIMEGLNNYNIVGYSNNKALNDISLNPQNISEYNLKNGRNIIECDDYTPDSTNFYYNAKINKSRSVFLSAFFWIFIIFVCFQILKLFLFDKNNLINNNNNNYIYKFIENFITNIAYILCWITFIALFIALVTSETQYTEYTNNIMLQFFFSLWVLFEICKISFCDLSIKNTHTFFLSLTYLTSIWITFMICGLYNNIFLKFDDKYTLDPIYYIIMTLYFIMSVFCLISINKS